MPAGPVLASIGYEAGLSAIAGVIVFALSLPFAPEVDLPVPLWTMLGVRGAARGGAAPAHLRRRPPTGC